MWNAFYWKVGSLTISQQIIMSNQKTMYSHYVIVVSSSPWHDHYETLFASSCPKKKSFLAQLGRSVSQWSTPITNNITINPTHDTLKFQKNFSLKWWSVYKDLKTNRNRTMYLSYKFLWTKNGASCHRVKYIWNILGSARRMDYVKIYNYKDRLNFKNNRFT